MNSITAPVRLVGGRIEWHARRLPWLLPWRHAVFEHFDDGIGDFLAMVTLRGCWGGWLLAGTHLGTPSSAERSSKKNSVARSSVSNPEPMSGSPPISLNSGSDIFDGCIETPLDADCAYPVCREGAQV